MRTLSLLLALTPVVATPPGCATPPRVSLQVRRIAGSRPELALLRCIVDPPRPEITWTFVGVHSLVDPPPTSDAVLVQLPGPSALAQATCSVRDEGKVSAATRSLAPLAITNVTPPCATPPSATITVDGTGFGPARGRDDAVYLLPPIGRAVRADHDCRQASWSERRIVVCAPAGLRARFSQLRVQAGGALASYAGQAIRTAGACDVSSERSP